MYDIPPVVPLSLPPTLPHTLQESVHKTRPSLLARVLAYTIYIYYDGK